jgi:membrane protein DedA with SNARE-associated domain
VGDNAGYWIGRRYGVQLIRVRGIRRVYSERRLRAADEFFARRGWLAVFFGRFVALLRIFAGPLAGMHRMPWPKFLLANALGAVVWATAMTILGLMLGTQLDRALRLASRSGYVGLGIAAVVVLALVGRRILSFVSHR